MNTKTKKLSVMIPTYNEEENVRAIYEAVRKQIIENLPEYDYEFLFIDNKSQDRTREILREICAEDSRVRAIFNIANFGQFNSPFYGLGQTTGDCSITMSADFQDPPELIPTLVHEWETGKYTAVVGVKTDSQENKIIYFIRDCYYRLIKAMSNTQMIRQFTGFGLYDKSFVTIVRSLRDPIPFMRGVVAEYAPNRKEVPFTQPKRRAGKSSNNFFTLYDAAMLSFTSYTKLGLRIGTLFGFGIAGISFLIALGYFIAKLIWWNTFSAGAAPTLIAVFFIGGVQLAFMGFMGEYILSINQRVMNRPLVVEEERLNFDEEEA